MILRFDGVVSTGALMGVVCMEEGSSNRGGPVICLQPLLLALPKPAPAHGLLPWPQGDIIEKIACGVGGAKNWRPDAGVVRGAGVHKCAGVLRLAGVDSSMVGKRWERLAPELWPEAEGGLRMPAPWPAPLAKSKGEKQEWLRPNWVDCGESAEEAHGGTKEPCSPKHIVDVGGRFCGEGSVRVHAGRHKPEEDELVDVVVTGAPTPGVRAGGDSSSEGMAWGVPWPGMARGLLLPRERRVTEGLG